MENREIKRLSAENEEIKRRIAKIKVENTANELREQTVFQEDVFVLNDVSLIKTLKIYAVEETGASVKLTFLPEEVHERWIFVNCNDCAFKIYSNGEISKDIPVFLNKGENLLTVEICQDIRRCFPFPEQPNFYICFCGKPLISAIFFILYLL